MNLPHVLALSAEEAQALHPPAGADAQHASWQWLTLQDAASSATVHCYVQRYASWLAQNQRVT